MLTYTVQLDPQKEGGYTVTVPSLPGCISEGETIDEALRNIQEAIEGYLLTLVAHGRKLPLEFSSMRSVSVSLKKKAKNKREKAYA
jgi:antitoxin HicB